MGKALIIVDVQPTFCEGGELGVEGGNAVAERIAKYVESHRGEYAYIATTQDWHIDRERTGRTIPITSTLGRCMARPAPRTPNCIPRSPH